MMRIIIMTFVLLKGHVENIESLIGVNTWHLVPDTGEMYFW